MAPKICTLLSYFSQLLYKTYVSVQIFNLIQLIFNQTERVYSLLVVHNTGLKIEMFLLHNINAEISVGKK